MSVATIPERPVYHSPLTTHHSLAVRCRGVTKQFGAGEAAVLALRGVDAEVRLGELTLFVGPSGCGKTTLISVIAGLLDPTAGEVEVFGEELTTFAADGSWNSAAGTSASCSSSTTCCRR